MSDQRERRRQSAQSGSSFDPKAIVKKFWIPAAILIIASTVTAVQVAGQDSSETCDGSTAVHWHAMYSVYVDDQRVSFDPVNRPIFGQAGESPGVGFHIHGDNNRLHFHPGTPKCISLGDAMQKLGVTFDGSDTMRLDGNLHPGFGGTYQTNETHELYIYTDSWDYVAKEHDGKWKRVSNAQGFLADMPENGDRILFSYGALSDAELESQRESLGFIGDSYVPQGKKIFVPVMMTWIFAVGGLYIWGRMAGMSQS